MEDFSFDTRVPRKNKKREIKNRKLFSLKAMEVLVDKISFLSNKYDKLAINAQEKLGYHFNEILNILLFHKYVKNNKKYFRFYLKVKSALNKGYEYKKEKREKIDEMENQNNEINSNYTHFAVNADGKILNGWDYTDQLPEDLKANPKDYFTKDLIEMGVNTKDVKINTKKGLSQKRINFLDPNNWINVPDNSNQLEETTDTGGMFPGGGFPIMKGAINTSKNQNMWKPPMNPNIKKAIKKSGGQFVLPNAKTHDIGINAYKMYENQNYDFIDPSNEVNTPIEEDHIDQNNRQGMIDYIMKNQNNLRKTLGSTDFRNRSTRDLYKNYQNLEATLRNQDSLSEEGMDTMNMPKEEPMYVEYVADIPNESRFRIGDYEYQNVKAKYPDGKVDIGVYIFGQDAVYSYDWFKKNVLGNPKGNQVIPTYNSLQESEKKHPFIKNIVKIHKENEKNAKTYFKKDVSSKATTNLVNGKDSDVYKYDKDTLSMEDIKKYPEDETSKDYYEKIHRGLEDFEPEGADTKNVKDWEKRKKELAGDKVYNDAQKRIEAKNKYGLGYKRPSLTQKFEPKIKDEDKLLKEMVQSYYFDERNRKKFVIFQLNEMIETKDSSILTECKELIYKGLGQTLSEDFKNIVKNKKIMFSSDEKKIYLV